MVVIDYDKLIKTINEHIANTKCSDPNLQKFYELGEEHIKCIVDEMLQYEIDEKELLDVRRT